mgnify:CR=1 FL=1
MSRDPQTSIAANESHRSPITCLLNGLRNRLPQRILGHGRPKKEHCPVHFIAKAPKEFPADSVNSDAGCENSSWCPSAAPKHRIPMANHACVSTESLSFGIAALKLSCDKLAYPLRTRTLTGFHRQPLWTTSLFARPPPASCYWSTDIGWPEQYGFGP